jgi:hypothetical protein
MEILLQPFRITTSSVGYKTKLKIKDGKNVLQSRGCRSVNVSRNLVTIFLLLLSPILPPLLSHGRS